ncbi:MAG: hypothetical protein Q7S28_01400, partial [bacterium]|nr:hypothetical protein [bacterium]
PSQASRTTPKAPRVINYSASKPAEQGGVFAEPLGSPFSKPASDPSSAAPPPPPAPAPTTPPVANITPPDVRPKLDATPLYKPLSNPPPPFIPQANKSFSPSPLPVVSGVELPPPPPLSTPSAPLPSSPASLPSPNDPAVMRHENFVDLTHLDKKP